MAEETISIEGISYRVSDGLLEGAVEHAQLNKAGLVFEAWAANRNHQKLPKLGFMLNDVECSALAGATREPIADNKSSGGSAIVRERFFIPVGIIPFPFKLNVRVFAFDEETRVASQIYCKESQALELLISNGGDFRKFIQDPSTRITDPMLIVYAAYHCANRFAINPGMDEGGFMQAYIIRSSAACVMGYRLIEYPDIEADLKGEFEDLLGTMLSTSVDFKQGVFIRWWTSLLLIAGYWALKSDKIDEALRRFRELSYSQDKISSWPSLVSNVLIGILLTGYLHSCKGETSAAKEQWARARQVLRTGFSEALLSNFYAYEELKNAVAIAQECFVGEWMATNGGPISDSAVGPTGRTVNLARVPNFNLSGGVLLRLLEDVRNRTVFA